MEEEIQFLVMKGLNAGKSTYSCQSIGFTLATAIQFMDAAAFG